MSPPIIEVRLLKPEDVAIFRTIRMEALRTEPGSFSSSAAKWEALTDEEWVRRLTNPVFVAFQRNTPTGIMGLMPGTEAKWLTRATLVMVYVCKHMRGSGVASLLLDTVVAYARDHDIRQLELAVSGDCTPAIRFSCVKVLGKQVEYLVASCAATGRLTRLPW